MDTLRAARYPFLDSASEFVKENGADIRELLTTRGFEEARTRGLARVQSAILTNEIDRVDLTRPYDRLVEALSYPYARIIVSAIDDRYLTKRYALAEGVHMYETLQEDEESVQEVADKLELRCERVSDDRLAMPFPDFLKYASRMKSSEWKLINNEISGGMVLLEKRRYMRLLQTALQDKIERELPLNIPDEFEKYIRADVEKAALVLNDTRNSMSSFGTGEIKLECLPPCMKAIIANAQNGVNLSHSARFAMVAYLNAIGVDYDGIIKIFSRSPDFNEAMSSYQIKHIMGENRGGEGYTPPVCATMKTNGLCTEPDDLCNNEKVNHPLTYYRIKSR